MYTIPYFEDEQSKLKPGLQPVERESINAILYDPARNQILCLDWKEWGWRTFIIGGVEGGEDPVQAALREIGEETGYKNIRFVSELGKTRSGYFAAHKNENRISNATGLLFELLNDEKDEVNQSALPHIFVWMHRDQVSDYLTLSSQKYIWDRAQALLHK